MITKSKGIYKMIPDCPKKSTFYKDPIHPKYQKYHFDYWPRSNGRIGEHVLSGFPYYSPHGNN